MIKTVQFQKVSIGPRQPFTLFSGPCVIENEDHALSTAEILKTICDSFKIQLIYKSSYDKANRSAGSSFRGPGIDEGLRILEKVKKQFDLPILTDVHSPYEAKLASEVCDVLQIPAFLCRQTDLILAAASTGSVIKVKKGQFLAPTEMQNIIDKILSTGNDRIILTDRGTCFGYNNLVSDMRAIPIMQKTGYPVCFDATHSIQLPGGLGTCSGGEREFIFPLAKAALAAGANCLFMESHPNPDQAKSDAKSVLSIKELSLFLPQLKQIYDLVQGFACAHG